MSIPEEVAAKKKEIIAKLELLQRGLLDSERATRLRESLKVDDDGNLRLFENGKFVTLIGEVTGGEVHVGDKFVIGAEALQDLINPPEINWQEASRAFLGQNTERLTTNPMTHCEGIVHETEQVYIPLGLVERKKQSRREDDVSPEQGSSLYEETEITRRFEHREFISRVLVEGDSPKSKGRRISIIGEPGAGKTTSLQQIANWVANNVDDAIVVWIPLADLQGRSVEDYLFERWLLAVARISGYAEVSRLIKDEFVSLFQQDSIWLMLDGVDEVSGVFRNPLNELDSQLTGTLLSQARVLLTCRLNLWDGNRHSLDNFDIYRTLEFSYPLQVEGFIDNWFALRAKSTLAMSLRAALAEPKARRIQDLVKNPLRLALLCFSWSLREGTLPETQAQLYAQYVESIYDWKRALFPITRGQRRLLDAALSMLSCRAIDGTDGYLNSRFRLREALVKEHLDKPLPGGTGTILDLALKIGWINQVGVDATDPTMKIFAFYHTTFEEYFAALGIEQGNFFFSHSNWNVSSKRNSYRLLENQWKQVFILWCGRTNVTAQEKDHLTRGLINFKDGCRGFYSDGAFFIACDGINEFDSIHARKIVGRLMRWRESGLLDYLLLGEEKAHERSGNAIEAIKQTRDRNNNSQLAIRHLTTIVQGKRIIWERRSPAALLEAIDPGNELAIQILFEIINGELCQELDDRRYAIEDLGELVSPSIEVIQVLCKALGGKSSGATAAKSLEKIIENSESRIELDSIILEVSKSLKSLRDLKFDTAPSDINGFFESLSSSPRGVIKLLEKIGIGSRIAHRALVELLDYKIGNTNDPYDLPSIKRIVQSISKISINADSNSVIRKALQILHIHNVEVDKDTSFTKLLVERNLREEEQAREVDSASAAQSFVKNRAVSLFEFDESCKLVGKEMISIIESTDEQAVEKEAVMILTIVVERYYLAIHTLTSILRVSQDEDVFRMIAERLCNLFPDNELVLEILTDRAVDTDSDRCAAVAIEMLGEIKEQDSSVVETLSYLVKSSRDETILFNAIESLRKFHPEDPSALRSLRKLSSAAQNTYIRISSNDRLGNLLSEREAVVENLIHIIEHCNTTAYKDENICKYACHVLSEISANNSWAISELNRLLMQGMGWLSFIVIACLIKICANSGKQIIPKLLEEIEANRDQSVVHAMTGGLSIIGKEDKRVVCELVVH